MKGRTVGEEQQETENAKRARARTKMVVAGRTGATVGRLLSFSLTHILHSHGRLCTSLRIGNQKH